VDSQPDLSSTPKSHSFHAQESSPPADLIESQRQRLAELIGQLLAEQLLRENQGKCLNHCASEEPVARSSPTRHPPEPTTGVL
jgi:hypothetical protein